MSNETTGSTGYYIRIRGKIHGPFDVERLKKLQARGQFSRANEISVDKHSWQPATTLAELFEPAGVTFEEVIDPAARQPDPVESPADVPKEAPVEDGWHYVVDEQQHGPFSLAELKRLVSNGVLKRHDLVWRAGMPEWRPVSQIPQLFAGGKGSQWYSLLWSKEGLVVGGGILSLAVVCAIGWFAYGQLSHGSGALIKFNNGQLYYTSPFSEEDARRLGNFLVQERVFDGEQKTIQLTKSDKTTAVRVIVKKGVEMDQDYVHALRRLGGRISHEVFADAPVEIHMCDDRLDTLRVIPTEPLASKR